MTAAPPLPPVAILAGGLATRMRPVTETIPKSLLDIDGEPFVARQLRLLRSRGVDRVVLCVGHLGAMIESVVGDGRQFGLEVRYSWDGDRLLGTGGAIRRALPLLDDPFFTLYGDSWLACDYRAVADAFAASPALALMTVYRNDGQWDASNVEFDGRRILAYDKANRTPRMRHIDWGLGMFRHAAFDDVPDDAPCDLASVYQRMLADGSLTAFETDRRFHEIGSLAGLEEMRRLARGTLPPPSSEGVAGSSHMEDRPVSFADQYLDETARIARSLDRDAIERVADLLAAARERGGRLFILGVGGSAGNASHAVNDFRKIAAFEAYAPTDNVPELTARTNDEGWETVFEQWLRGSRLDRDDVVLVLSVGGGDEARNVSPNLVRAVRHAKSVGAGVCGIVGRPDGYTAQVADACVVVPEVNPEHVTPHSESFQAVVWHLLVSHPRLKAAPTKWESIR